MEATRAIKIHHIPISKTHKVVSDDLGHRLQRIIVMLILSKPQMRHEYEAVGQTCVIEFSSLLDAIEVFHWFMNDKISGYEGSKPQFVPEKTSRPIPGKPYCGCLNCVDARSRETRRKQKRDEELMAQYNRASTRASNSNSNYARTQSGSVPGSANGNKTGKEGSGNPEELDEDLGRLLDDGPEDWEAVPQN